MSTAAAALVQGALFDGRMLSWLSLKISHLFEIKEKQRLIIGDFINSEILSHNARSHVVKRYPLTYQLAINGDFDGSVILNLEPELAEVIARSLLGETVVADDIDAVMQELLNIFGGHLAIAFNELGIDFDITTPHITNEDFITGREGRRILFRFSCNERILQFILVLKPRKSAA